MSDLVRRAWDRRERSFCNYPLRRPRAAGSAHPHIKMSPYQSRKCFKPVSTKQDKFLYFKVNYSMLFYMSVRRLVSAISFVRNNEICNCSILKIVKSTQNINSITRTTSWEKWKVKHVLWIYIIQHWNSCNLMKTEVCQQCVLSSSTATPSYRT